MSRFDLTGKVAIITGSSKGIGKAIAKEFAAHGAQVVISSRKFDACERVAEEINADHGGGTAIPVAANISDKTALQELVDASKAAFSKIDILVCNAATNPHFGPMADISDAQFQKILTNNVIANHWLIHMVAPEMIERRDGTIIVVSSTGGMVASTTIGAYAVSKAADFQLVRNLAAEFGRYNIRVNAIAPGTTRTDQARVLWENPAVEQAMRRVTPLDRIGEPEDIAGVALFLASSASRHMTGQALVVDGGATIGGIV